MAAPLNGLDGTTNRSVDAFSALTVDLRADAAPWEHRRSTLAECSLSAVAPTAHERTTLTVTARGALLPAKTGLEANIKAAPNRAVRRATCRVRIFTPL